MNNPETSFYVEKGYKEYGPFETADDAVRYASRIGLGHGVEYHTARISEHRGRMIHSKEITREEFERLSVEGIPQLDGSILFIP